MRATLNILLLLLVIFSAAAAAQTPDGDPPSEEAVCDNFTGAAFGLCNAYCEAMDCDSPDSSASPRACERKFQQFQDLTGSPPPCVDITCPCVDEVNFPDFTLIATDPFNANIATCQIDDDQDTFFVIVNEVIVGFAEGGVDQDEAGCGGSDGFLDPITLEEGTACAMLLLDAAESVLGGGACTPL